MTSLHRTPSSDSATRFAATRSRAAIDQIVQQPQRQDALDDQLRDLITAANKLGCYDAAGWIRMRTLR